MASSDLLLHPVRLRIVQAFLGDRALTTSQLAAELGDVSPGTLYRHVAALAKAGILEVKSERQARGSTERTYVLRVEAARLGVDDLANMTKHDHANAFMAFVAGLLADYDRYLASGEPDLIRDGVGYSVAGVWVTDAEYSELAQEVRDAIMSRMGNGPAPGRRRRLIANVFMLSPEETPVTLRTS